ncbi:MAG: hypothetical protein A2X59_10055 [Nitrospirae bacterium GWC2_42_7]|nr:MAG: hypothetical protein A2X59_10055 [Nitrospirae bacterium GWC2_42_7]
MGRARKPEKAVLFIGSLFSQTDIFIKAMPLLKKEFGDIFFESPVYKWAYTSFYEKELGTPIYRSFVFFSGLFDTSRLPEAKLLTNEIEDIFSDDNKRKINLDPGYITLAKVVLASTKNYSHRIYLGKGIYADLALIFKKNKGFEPQPYTYNDYKDQKTVEMFSEARNSLKVIF